MHRILFLLSLIYCSTTFGQLTEKKIVELKNIEEVSLGHAGDFATGKPYDVFSNIDIDIKNISGYYTDFGGGDFSINYIIKYNKGIFEITRKEEGIDLNGNLKTKFHRLKILNIKQNKIATNEGVFIFSKAQKGAIDDNKAINGFLIITTDQAQSPASFIWKQ